MTSVLLSLLVALIIGGLLLYLVQLLPLPPPFPVLITAVVVIICILTLLSVVPGGWLTLR